MTTTELYRSTEAMTLERNDDGTPGRRLSLTFARFNVWNEIYSWEGRFLELLEPGSFAETFAERGPEGTGMLRALFQHGRDPVAGNKPLGPVVEAREDDIGPRFEVDLLDVGYVNDVRAGIIAGLYGASYRFGVRMGGDGVLAESWDYKPARSEHNPEGIPERRIHAVNVAEAGPVTFPADEGTNDAGMVGVRSLDYLFADRQRLELEDLSPGAVEASNTAAADATTALSSRAAALGVGARARAIRSRH